MLEARSFTPEWAAAPGLTIQHALAERGRDASELSLLLHRPPSFVADLLVGRQEIDAELAEALARVVGSTSRFWMAREREYRSSLSRVVANNRALMDWVSVLPVKEMTRLGWIQHSTGPACIAECLQFFGVSSQEKWRERYEVAVISASYRTSQSFDNETPAVAAWLRRGEIEASLIKCSPWNADLLRKQIPYLRALTRSKAPSQFFPLLQSTCADAGVAVVVVPAPKGCRASGVARFVSPVRALLQLSQRYGTDDQFWFTFFHELGHLLLHAHTRMFIDEPERGTSQEEREANEFASDVLLPRPLREKLSLLPARYRDLLRFAKTAGVSPGIVVGQMQYLKLIDFNRLNRAKRKLDWSS